MEGEGCKWAFVLLSLNANPQYLVFWPVLQEPHFDEEDHVDNQEDFRPAQADAEAGHDVLCLVPPAGLR